MTKLSDFKQLTTFILLLGLQCEQGLAEAAQLCSTQHRQGQWDHLWLPHHRGPLMPLLPGALVRAVGLSLSPHNMVSGF